MAEVWYTWVSNSTATTSSTTSNYVWDAWQGTGTTATTITYAINTAPAVITPEEEERRRVAAEVWYDQRVQQLAKEREEREAAGAKARQLLLDMLNEVQREMYEKDAYFMVEGSRGGVYRIDDGFQGNVRCELRHRRYCGHLRDSRIPVYDHMLAQKLMLETDEEAFLAVANPS